MDMAGRKRGGSMSPKAGVKHNGHKQSCGGKIKVKK